MQDTCPVQGANPPQRIDPLLFRIFSLPGGIEALAGVFPPEACPEHPSTSSGRTGHTERGEPVEPRAQGERLFPNVPSGVEGQAQGEANRESKHSGRTVSKGLDSRWNISKGESGGFSLPYPSSPLISEALLFFFQPD